MPTFEVLDVRVIRLINGDGDGDGDGDIVKYIVNYSSEYRHIVKIDTIDEDKVMVTFSHGSETFHVKDQSCLIGERTGIKYKFAPCDIQTYRGGANVVVPAIAPTDDCVLVNQTEADYLYILGFFMYVAPVHTFALIHNMITRQCKAVTLENGKFIFSPVVGVVSPVSGRLFQRILNVIEIKQSDDKLLFARCHVGEYPILFRNDKIWDTFAVDTPPFITAFSRDKTQKTQFLFSDTFIVNITNQCTYQYHNLVVYFGFPPQIWDADNKMYNAVTDIKFGIEELDDRNSKTAAVYKLEATDDMFVLKHDVNTSADFTVSLIGLSQYLEQ